MTQMSDKSLLCETDKNQISGQTQYNLSRLRTQEALFNFSFHDFGCEGKGVHNFYYEIVRL